MENIPLVVDLDGTLLYSDLLHEAIIILLRKNPLYLFSLIIWILKGKVYFKNQIFKRAQLSYSLLPWNKELLNFLRTESVNGRELILATASLKSNADEIRKQFPIFNEIYGTKDVNLKGGNKLEILIDKFGEFQFDYIGNSNCDLKIFASSRYTYLVNPSRSLVRKTRRVSELKYIWQTKKSRFNEYLKAIRAYQWVKNLLIFIPLITSHSFFAAKPAFSALLGFFAFSFAASSGYILNDLLDLNSDRSHPRKCNRPFASGKLSLTSGILLASVFLAFGLLVASQLNIVFSLILCGYFTASLCYSCYLKKLALYDVFILALLYSTRIIGGGAATRIPISFWLITFSTFIFLSLAFVKRYSELLKVDNISDLKNRGRGYIKVDLNLLQIMGIATGFLSVVVFSLYIDSPDVSQLYSSPKILWAVSFLLLLWISRIWLITTRGQMTDDPVIFAIKDPSSYFTFFCIGLIIYLSI